MSRTALVLLLLIGAHDAFAQVAVRRPRLPAADDPNDAAAYVRLAKRLLYTPTDSAHAAAEAALFWAARLDPGSGDPPYLLAVAVLRPIMVEARREGRFSRRLLRRELTPHRQRYIDSLMREAWLREPFYNIELEPLLCPTVIPPEGIVDPVARGYFAYQFREPQLAVDAWKEAITREPRRVDLRLHRAHTFYWMQRYDSTITELRGAIASLAPADSETWAMLPPVHLLEYALGVAMERAGQPDSAKAAYQRALVGNLGLYMARVRLSAILLAERDTAQAVSEVARAVDIVRPDPWLTTYHGYVLLQAGRPAEAAARLLAAITHDSAYATPHFLLGLAYSAQSQDSAALVSFEAFLSRSPQTDERRAWTAQRVSTLRTAGPRE